MSIREQIESDLKDAMRARNELARETLRMAIAGFKNKRIELGRDLEAADELAVVQKNVKSRQDSAEQYENAGRPELAEKERAEIAILQGYLPKQLNEDETRTVVQELIKELGLDQKSQLGQLMKAAMAKYKGQIDGKLVSRFAGEMLG